MKGYRLTQPLVVILAAGFSRRLGRPKAQARIRGMSLLRRTLRLGVACTALPPLCILPPRSGALKAQLQGHGMLRIAINARRAEGLASSVRLGLARGRYAAAILWLPVDLPELRSAELLRLVRRWCGARRRIVARRLTGSAPPRGAVPMILPKSWFDAASRVRGDVGLRDLLAAAPPALLRLVKLPSADLDIDTPADLTRARRRYARGSGIRR